MGPAYRNTSGRNLAICGWLCLSIVLTAYSSHNPLPVEYGWSVTSEVFRPLYSVRSLLFGTLREKWDNYVALIGTKEENRHLRSRLQSLEAANSKLIELQSENERLRELLEVAKAENIDGLPANIIAHNPSSWVEAVTVDKGSSDGVAIGMAVVEGKGGVVGQVTSTSPSTARILLMTDHSSGVDAIVQSSRVRGVVVGGGEGRARLNFVLAPSEVQIGDRVITSGYDGIYPKGLLIGLVSAAESGKDGKLFKTIDLKPSVDFARLESVLIVRGVSRSEN